MLTVAIPTYNRERQLIQTLKYLEAQTCQDFNIFISDNNSDYDVHTAIYSNFNENFCEKITLRKRKVNVGGDNNIVGMFEAIDKGWLWIVSDDDVEKHDAIETIKGYICKYRDYAVIQFSFFEYINQEHTLTNIEEYVNLMYDKVNKNTAIPICGDFCSSLNKVYNIDVLGSNVELAFQFSNCCMTTGLVLLNALAHSKKVLITKGNFLEFGPNFWNIKRVALAASSLGNINLNIEYNLMKKLLYIINIPYRMPLHYWLLSENHWDEDSYIEKLYYGFYKYHLPIKERLDYYIRMKFFSITFIYKIHLYFVNLEHSLRNKRVENK